MGLAGPAPTPTPIRDLRGNPGKRPYGAAVGEPESPPSAGIPPSWLPAGRPQTLWRDIYPLLMDMKIMTVADEIALASLCVELAEYIFLVNEIRRGGRTYESELNNGTTVTRERHAVSQRAEAWARTVKLLLQFGMTPAGRTRVRAVAEGEEDTFGNLFGTSASS